MSSHFRPTRQTYKGPEGEACVVDRVALSSDKNNNLVIKYLIRHTRRPEVTTVFCLFGSIPVLFSHLISNLFI